METEGLSHTLLQVCIFGGVKRPVDKTGVYNMSMTKLQHARSEEYSLSLKTGDTTWTPCGAVNRKSMASGSSQAACSQFWLVTHLGKHHLTCELQLSWPCEVSTRCFIL